jgi:PIN domain nuclease of toxin-antitoxin system
MATIILDTASFILYAREPEKLSAAALRLLDESSLPLAISAITIVELRGMVLRGSLREREWTILNMRLADSHQQSIEILPVDLHVAVLTKGHSTSVDPLDVVVASAKRFNRTLITCSEEVDDVDINIVRARPSKPRVRSR